MTPLEELERNIKRIKGISEIERQNEIRRRLAEWSRPSFFPSRVKHRKLI